jgi:hypothetical protein
MNNYKVNSKEVIKIPYGITNIYEVDHIFDYPKDYIQKMIYSRTIANSGKVKVYFGFAKDWQQRKYKHYTDILSPIINQGIYKDMEEAVKEYESQ